ncbi:gluconolactonase [Allorhodopirellula heiligendammensis]|uniref:Uncharacterized protein n=1 Tax=Allorhodopirellula heiligendammensis TaxID=2714739 RepID=A0A5C6BG51_9BACT|nr:gluconolactonase [Allorhodopirellula heiligendammensis]TWU11133.1 hypothetical protein Poly21_50400 [Allorhodopirellula heiligendammensis]
MSLTLSRRTSLLSAACCCGITAGVLLSFQSVCAAPPAATADEVDTQPSAAPTTKIEIFGAGTLVVPAEFKPAKKANNIIDHEFAVSVGEGADVQTARVTMMPASGGVKANIERWIGQFSGTAKKVVPTEETVSGKWDVYVVKISGDYSERMGGGPFAGGRFVKRSDYAMMGAILIEPDQDSPEQPEFAHRREYFVKMIGPESVIDAHGKAFKKMVNSVGQ